MSMSNWEERSRAVEKARELHSTTRYTKREACVAALNASPSVKLSPDQLKGLAFGVTWHGFGSKEEE